MGSIPTWAPEERPREKLLKDGRTSLCDAELIALLLGSGAAGMNALELGRLVLKRSGHNLNTLAELSVKDLMKEKGIGEAKAMALVAAMELGRRRRLQDPVKRYRICSSRDAHNLLYAELCDLPHEEFWIQLLNRANSVIAKKRISSGGVAGTVADPRIIYRTAIEALASSIIVAHNHPSGNLAPSKEDIEVTQKLKGAGKLVDIKLMDHLIIAGDKYHSFADEGML